MHQKHVAASWELSNCASAAKKHLHSIQVHDLPSQPTPCIQSPESILCHGIPATGLACSIDFRNVAINQKSSHAYPAGITWESRHSESHVSRKGRMQRVPWQRSAVSSFICTSCRATKGGKHPSFLLNASGHDCSCRNLSDTKNHGLYD